MHHRLLHPLILPRDDAVISLSLCFQAAANSDVCKASQWVINKPDFGSLPLHTNTGCQMAPRRSGSQRRASARKHRRGRTCRSLCPSPRWRPPRRRVAATPHPGCHPRPRDPARPSSRPSGPRSALPAPLPARAPPRSQAARSAAPISRHCAK